MRYRDKNFKLNCGKFEDNIFEKNEIFGGFRYVFKFDNNYGASVIKALGSYGYQENLWELAVVEFFGDTWVLANKTCISNDVIGWLNDKQVVSYLEMIKNLCC